MKITSRALLLLCLGGVLFVPVLSGCSNNDAKPTAKDVSDFKGTGQIPPEGLKLIQQGQHANQPAGGPPQAATR